jgi:hypothetical protein
MGNIVQLSKEETNNNQVTLVVPSSGDATRLVEFIERIKQIFAARAMGILGSWEETTITFETDTVTRSTDILDKLLNMPEVENVENKETKNHDVKHEGILVTLATNT